jgi:hypothetical protein
MGRVVRTITKVTITLGAATALTLGLTAAVGAASTARTSGDRQLGAQSQLAANTVADHVDTLVSATHVTGFAGEEVLPTEPGLDVYWHGRPPATVTRLTFGVARRLGVAVRFLSAPYSLAQLLGFRSQINNEPGFAKSGVSMILIYPQATGLYIGVAHGSLRARRFLPVIARSRIPVHFYPASIVPFDYGTRPKMFNSALPIELRTRVLPTSDTLPGRWEDTPPFAGGAFIYTQYAGLYEECSSGFTVHFANAPKKYFMLTAGHCIAYKELGTQVFKIEGNDLKLGTTYSFSGGNDAVSLAPVNGTADDGAFIYTGSTSLTTSKGQALATVKGADAVQVGDVVSQSGAWSGERTGIKISDTEAEWTLETNDGLEYDAFGAYGATSNKAEAAGQGDSGGPVFINVKGGVSAVGLVSAGTTAHLVPCVGIIYKDRKCSSDLLFPLMTGTSTSIESDMNLAVNTG